MNCHQNSLLTIDTTIITKGLLSKNQGTQWILNCNQCGMQFNQTRWTTESISPLTIWSADFIENNIFRSRKQNKEWTFTITTRTCAFGYGYIEKENEYIPWPIRSNCIAIFRHSEKFPAESMACAMPGLTSLIEVEILASSSELIINPLGVQGSTTLLTEWVSTKSQFQYKICLLTKF